MSEFELTSSLVWDNGRKVQREWTLAGAEGDHAPTVTFAQRPECSGWMASAFGRSWGDQRREGKDCTECLREDAAFMVAMADFIDAQKEKQCQS